MASRSAQTGDFPQLPFRGPPHTVDRVTEEHFSTIARPFSPNARSRSPSRSPMAIDLRTAEERPLEVSAGDTSVSTISKTHVLTSPIRSNRSMAAASAYNNSQGMDALSHLSLSHSVSVQSGQGQGAGSGNASVGYGNGSMRKLASSGAGIGIAGRGSAGGSVSLTTAGKVSLWGTFRKTLGSSYDEEGTI